MGFNCLKATEPGREDSLLFTTKSPGVPGTHFIDHRRMKVQLITVNLQYNGIKITKQCSDVNCVKSVCIRGWSARITSHSE